MNNDSVEVTVKGVMPTSNGCAIFLGNDEKTFVIYVDPAIGNAINMTINQVKKERPLTHDLIGLILRGLETHIERVLINDVDEGTFFARIILQMQNELGKKIIELDNAKQTLKKLEVMLNESEVAEEVQKGKDKTKAVLYDIADDCSYKEKKNYTLNHLIERIKTYNEEKFNYDIITIQIRSNDNDGRRFLCDT